MLIGIVILVLLGLLLELFSISQQRKLIRMATTGNQALTDLQTAVANLNLTRTRARALNSTSRSSSNRRRRFCHQ